MVPLKRLGTVSYLHSIAISNYWHIFSRFKLQDDHSSGNVKFPDGSQHSSAALGMLSVTHIMPVLVLLSVVGVKMQQCMIRNHLFNI